MREVSGAETVGLLYNLRLSLGARRLWAVLFVHQLPHQIDILQRLDLRALFIVHSARMAANGVFEIKVIVALLFEPRGAFAPMRRVGAVIGGGCP